MDREKFLSAVYFIFEKDDKILLQKRKGTKLWCGFWSLPAGHLDGNESCYEASIREIKEELGLNIDINNLKNPTIIQRNDMLHGAYYDVFFDVINWKGEPKIMEPNKCEELRWFSKKELPEKMINFVKESIYKHYNGIYFDCIRIDQEN